MGGPAGTSSAGGPPPLTGADEETPASGSSSAVDVTAPLHTAPTPADVAGYAAFITTPRPDQRAESITNMAEALDFIRRLQEFSSACLTSINEERERFRVSTAAAAASADEAHSWQVARAVAAEAALTASEARCV